MSAISRRLRWLHEKVAAYPEGRPGGIRDLLELRNAVPGAIEEIERLEAEVARLRHAKKRAGPEGLPDARRCEARGV